MIRLFTKIKMESVEFFIRNNIMKFGINLAQYLQEDHKAKMKNVLVSLSGTIEKQKSTQIIKKTNAPGKKKLNFHFFGLNPVYLILFFGFIGSVYFVFGYDLSLYKNVVLNSNQFILSTYYIQKYATNSALLMTNQLWNFNFFPTQHTPDYLIKALLSLNFAVDFNHDIFGYSVLLEQYNKDILAYNLCQLNKAEEFIQIYQLCLADFPDLIFENAVSIGSQPQTGENVKVVADMMFPDITKEENMKKHFVSFGNIVSFIKLTLQAELQLLKIGYFQELKNDQKKLNKYMEDRIKLHDYIYYAADFVHHVYVE